MKVQQKITRYGVGPVDPLAGTAPKSGVSASNGLAQPKLQENKSPGMTLEFLLMANHTLAHKAKFQQWVDKSTIILKPSTSFSSMQVVSKQKTWDIKSPWQTDIDVAIIQETEVVKQPNIKLYNIYWNPLSM